MEPNLEPQHIVREDGSHTAVCQVCGYISEVVVQHEKDEAAVFVLAADPTTTPPEPTEVTYGERAVFDFSEHERHIIEEHGAEED